MMQGETKARKRPKHRYKIGNQQGAIIAVVERSCYVV